MPRSMLRPALCGAAGPMLALLLLLLLLLACGPVAVFAQAPGAPAEQAASPRFDILTFEVDGNTVLTQSAIEDAIYPSMGPDRSLEDVERARTELERAYQRAGYLSASVDIPEQQVLGGVLRLRVVEASVARLRVKGTRWYTPSSIAAAVPSVAEGAVPNFPAFEKELGVLVRSGAYTVTPSLKPGLAAGTIDVELAVTEQKPWSATVEVNNHASVNTDSIRLLVGGRYTNLFQRRHSIGINYVVSPTDTDQVQVASVSYSLPMGSADDPTLALYLIKSDSNTPSSIGGTFVFGKQDIAGVRWVVPIRDGSGLIHSASMGADWKRLEQQDFVPITYLPFQLGYNALLPGEVTSCQLELSLNASMRNLVSDDQQFANRRYLGSASYLYLKADLAHERRFANGWSIRARAAAQYSQQPLIPSEQFAVGGANSVRGYYEAEQIGDMGALAGAEIRTPRRTVESADVTGWGVVYSEWARVEIREPLPEQIDSFIIGGVGLGLRARIGRRVSLGVDVARALRDASTTRRGDHRVHARLAVEL